MDLLMRIIVIPKINAMMGQRYPMEVVMDAMKVICVHNDEISGSPRRSAGLTGYGLEVS